MPSSRDRKRLARQQSAGVIEHRNRPRILVRVDSCHSLNISADHRASPSSSAADIVGCGPDWPADLG